MRHIIEQMPEAEHEEFRRLGYTIGGMMLFPGNKIGGKQTINAARGFNGSTEDRMDLTLECIRRHYLNEASPLSPVLERYTDFFELFQSFSGYVDFFLLQDLVTDEGAMVEFFMPFSDFAPPAVPRDLDSYKEYRRRSIGSSKPGAGGSTGWHCSGLEIGRRAASTGTVDRRACSAVRLGSTSAGYSVGRRDAARISIRRSGWP